MRSPGVLYVIATPIGNLADLSPRAIQTLKDVQLVLAEDTRTFRTLATNFDISTAVLSCHEQNERTASKEFLNRLQSGESLALVSENGTPTISDPGFRLVRECRRHGIAVCPIPGPSSVIAALSVSGLETNRFTFEGFLPQKSGKRETALRNGITNQTTTIFFESPYRIVATLLSIEQIAPKRILFVARELTKKFEECFYGTASVIRQALEGKPSIKGEFVLIIGCSDDEAG